jgi:hypothetical protein
MSDWSPGFVIGFADLFKMQMEDVLNSCATCFAGTRTPFRGAL